MSLILPHASSLPFVFCLLMLVSKIAAQNGPLPFNPPAVPLAVRSPYLNAWLRQGNSSQYMAKDWAQFWTMGMTIGWYASVIVDGLGYRIFGGDQGIPNVSTANQTAAEFTPTRTSFLFTAGNMQINATFLSPVEPNDLLRQSLPFSYFYMTAESSDGNAHTLRMYSEINPELITYGSQAVVPWTPNDTDGQYVVLNMSIQASQKYVELNHHATDATTYYSVKKIADTETSWIMAVDVDAQTAAANMSQPLSNTANFTGDSRPVVGIAIDWGSISSTPEPAVWALGLVRDPSIQYRTPEGTIQDRRPYFVSTFSDVESAVHFFLDDFTRALSAAQAFDARIMAAGTEVSSNYADLLALCTRQVLGSLDITLAPADSGDWDFSDVKVFMKNMGSSGSDGGLDGETQMSVNTVDTLYAAFPMFIYLNPELGGYLLAPLLEYQDSPAYLLDYASKNIGTAYPNATADGINAEHNYGVEESANMLIMTLAYSLTSGNGTFISKHYTLLSKWADYLISNAQTSEDQNSADFSESSGLPNQDQTNTVLKGIIGIASMAKIAELAGVNDDQDKYNISATSLIQQWQNESLAVDNSHVDFFLNQTNTNGLIYNLYADKLLQLNLVADTVYDVLTKYYGVITGQNKYGIPLANNASQPLTKTAWMMFAASYVSDTTIRDTMILQLHDYASANLDYAPFRATYDASTGKSSTDLNSPTQGGMFALLALNVTLLSVDVPSNGSTIPGRTSSPSASPFPASNKANAGAIAGAALGAVFVVGAIGYGVFFLIRRRRQHHVYQTRADPLVTHVPVRHSDLPGMMQSTQSAQSTGYLISGTSALDVNTSVTSTDAPVSVLHGRGDRYGTSPQQAMLAKQTLVNEQLRSEVDNLRRNLEQIQERVITEQAPPSYSDPM